MSHNKMLIDATHPEETRVVVLRNGRVEEFDYESAARRLLRGSIFLAKITRVEPSLQAAFVDYGGNRHGFLAFNEIHPDYYQIPHSDRQALIDAEYGDHRDDDDDEDEGSETSPQPDPAKDIAQAEADESTHTDADDDQPETASQSDTDCGSDPEDDAIDVSHLLPPEGRSDDDADAPSSERETSGSAATAVASEIKVVSEVITPDGRTIAGETVEHQCDDVSGTTESSKPRAKDSAAIDDDDDQDGDDDDAVDNVGEADALEEVPQRRRRRARSYKIQEVIKRRQIVLIQVVKEERGNKGAALTTYLSLAGRYTVLMPNTARGGGISRKITNIQDRKRLKAIAQDLDVPEGMGLIIRTAGAARTKQEIKRDFEYLLRLWENVRDLTLQSTAPSLVYEEGDLIKRSIRDLYSKDIDQILVAGEEAHKEAKGFMRMLMPSHTKNVVKYDEHHPIFAKYGIESQLNAMFSPVVQLKSGGYLVVNQTEALVAIDVNSGKSTKEFSIEQTALNTNLEAAEELSRQLKLRDLAGLIVVDFIDMDEKRNNRAVERRLKDCLKSDRARIQIGRISHFGLLEMSRQRLRTGVLEGSTMQCSHCQGTGMIRSTESVALAVLRALEDALMSQNRRSLQAVTSPEVAIYLLNHKRGFIQDMEQRYGVVIHVEASEAQQGANFSIERLNISVVDDMRRAPDSTAVSMRAGFSPAAVGSEVIDDVTTADAETDEDEDERRPRRRRRRRRRDEAENGTSDERAAQHGRRSRNEEDDENDTSDDTDDDTSQTTTSGDSASQDTDDDGNQREDGRRRPRRRGRRGGRRNRERNGQTQQPSGVAAPGAPQPSLSEATAEGSDASHDPADDSRAGQMHDQSADAAPVADHSGADDDNGRQSGSKHPPAESGTVDTVAAQMIPLNETPAPLTNGVDRSDDDAHIHDTPQPAIAAAEEATPDCTTQAPADATAHESARSPGEEHAGNGSTEPTRRPPGLSPIAAEPKLERVVVRPDQGGTDDAAITEGPDSASAADQASQPQKKGWWQRRFGG